METTFLVGQFVEDHLEGYEVVAIEIEEMSDNKVGLRILVQARHSNVPTIADREAQCLLSAIRYGMTVAAATSELGHEPLDQIGKLELSLIQP